tara:strand:+ start:813 stop:1121 length:309 start_codon:yes stop_codon:yes gene_type:complete
LNYNHFSKNAISHKELNAFLIKAKKDIPLHNSSENNRNQEEQDFNELINNWTVASYKILKMINSKEKVFTKNRDPESLMAFGAMGAHINMALHALKATGSDQ